MTRRERTLLIVLGAMAAFGLVLGFWLLVVSPWMTNRAQTKQLEDEYARKYTEQTDFEAKLPKLRGYQQRSLPGNPNVARHEYEALISSLLRSTGVPSGYTVTQKDPGDANRTPGYPKTPAYSRIGYEIVLRKVDLPTIVRFLQAYYKQPVLQQITRFNIKPGTAEANTGAPRIARADLEVTIMTEGLAIDGVEKRSTIVAVPTVYGAFGGGAGLGLLQQSPQVVRHMQPASLASLLAANRDYALLAAKDPFHGPLPELPPIKVDPPPKKGNDTPPPKPLDEINSFIRLNDFTRRSDGSVSAEIRDAANNFDYDISRRFSIDGDLKVTVKKLYYLSGVRKTLETFDDLVIVEDGTTTDRRFKVLDIRPEGLMLSETVFVKDETKPEATAEDSKSKTSTPSTKPGSSGKSSGPSKFPSSKKSGATFVSTAGQPLGAVVGGAAFLPRKPQEKRYFWPMGATLKEIAELKPDEAKLEETPMPRENPQGK